MSPGTPIWVHYCRNVIIWIVNLTDVLHNRWQYSIKSLLKCQSSRCKFDSRPVSSLLGRGFEVLRSWSASLMSLRYFSNLPIMSPTVRQSDFPSSCRSREKKSNKEKSACHHLCPGPLVTNSPFLLSQTCSQPGHSYPGRSGSDPE